MKRLALLTTLALVVGCDANDGRRPHRHGDDPVTGTSVPGDTDEPTEPSPTVAEPIAVDVAPDSGFQDETLGDFGRGRSLIAADFDNDGHTDLFVGNPGGESLILRNVEGPGTATGRRFELVQILDDGSLAWGAAAADYDNDGDIDVFLSNGGVECVGRDLLFRNELVETGTLSFVDVTVEAGLDDRSGGLPVATPSANAVWGDVDNDGDLDLFVDGQRATLCGMFPNSLARNTLWQNNGDGTFTDVTGIAGLAGSLLPTQNSTLFDFDNDGDLDLFESGFRKQSVFWRNHVVERGVPGFERITDELAAEGVDLGRATKGFASCAADLDNDGYEDLVRFLRNGTDEGDDELMHHVFANRAGVAFDDASEQAALDVDIYSKYGVMGCQLADVNGDGFFDVTVGNGGPLGGGRNRLFLGGPGITFDDYTHLIDYPAQAVDGREMPPYPYRTHGIVALDVDDDGLPELAIVNGGPAAHPDTVREPNRLFQFTFPDTPRFLVVAPRGNGVTTPRDGIGTRAKLTVRDPDGTERAVYRRLYGGSCFSAQHPFELWFGLGQSEPVQLDITWSDGETTTLTDDLGVTSLRVDQGGEVTVLR